MSHEKPISFINLRKSEMLRQPGDGLTTELAKVAVSLGYTLVCHDTHFANEVMAHHQVPTISSKRHIIVASNSGLLWDHFATHSACTDMDNAFDSLKKDFEAVDRLCDAREEVINKNMDRMAELTLSLNAHAQKIAKYEEALKYYADKNNWTNSYSPIPDALFKTEIAESDWSDKETISEGMRRYCGGVKARAVLDEAGVKYGQEENKN